MASLLPTPSYLVQPLQDEESESWEADGLLQLFRKLYLRFTGNSYFDGLMDLLFSASHTTGAPAGKKAAGIHPMVDYDDLAAEIGTTQENGDNGENGCSYSALIRIYLEPDDIEGLKREKPAPLPPRERRLVQLAVSGIGSDEHGDYVWGQWTALANSPSSAMPLPPRGRRAGRAGRTGKTGRASAQNMGADGLHLLRRAANHRRRLAGAPRALLPQIGGASRA